MTVALTRTTVTWELSSRWTQGTPGGYLEGRLTLPEDMVTGQLVISLVQAEQNAPHPCNVHLPFFTNRRRDVVEGAQERRYVDMEESEVCGRGGRKVVEVEGGEIAVSAMARRQRKVVGRVVEVDGARVVHLGTGQGELRVALIQARTKGKRREEKVEMMQAIQKARLRVVFVTDGRVDVTAMSQIIRNKFQPTGKKRMCLPPPLEETQTKKPPASSSFKAVPAPPPPPFEKDPAPFGPWEFSELPTISHIPSRLLAMAYTDANPATKRKIVFDTKIDFEHLKQLDEDPWVDIPWELPIYSLLEVMVEQNILDWNLKRILSNLRLTGGGKIFETFFGSPLPQIRERPDNETIERFVLHRYGVPIQMETCQKALDKLRKGELSTDRTEQECLFEMVESKLLVDNGIFKSFVGSFEEVVERVRKGESMAPLSTDLTEREAFAELVGSQLSRSIFHGLDEGLYVNYVLIVGARGPIVWRMW